MRRSNNSRDVLGEDSAGDVTHAKFRWPNKKGGEERCTNRTGGSDLEIDIGDDLLMYVIMPTRTR